MPVLRRSSASLSGSTLLQMGVRIAGVVALATLFSYLHVLDSVRTENLARLERYVVERSQREQDIFVLAQDNHVVLQKALEERIRALEHEDVDARFDSLFVRLPDGTVRNRPESRILCQTGALRTKAPTPRLPGAVPFGSEEPLDEPRDGLGALVGEGVLELKAAPGRGLSV